jgi:hypothetical protein
LHPSALPRPLNSSGRATAATSGRPRFTETHSVRSVLAVSSSCLCAEIISTRCPPCHSQFRGSWPNGGATGAAVVADSIDRGLSDRRGVDVPHNRDVYVSHGAVVIICAAPPVGTEEAQSTVRAGRFQPEGGVPLFFSFQPVCEMSMRESCVRPGAHHRKVADSAMCLRGGLTRVREGVK